MPEAVDQLGESPVGEAVSEGGVDQPVGYVAVGPGDRELGDLRLLRAGAGGEAQGPGRQQDWQDDTVKSRTHRFLSIRIGVAWFRRVCVTGARFASKSRFARARSWGDISRFPTLLTGGCRFTLVSQIGGAAVGSDAWACGAGFA